MLAHKAEDEGIAVAELMAGQAGHVNYAVIPGVVYTNPEVASVGKTEDELKAEGVDYKIGKFPSPPMAAPRRCWRHRLRQDSCRCRDRPGAGRAYHRQECRRDDPRAGDADGVSGSSEDLARTTHAHPTLSEAIREAALSLGDGAIHI